MDFMFLVLKGWFLSLLLSSPDPTTEENYDFKTIQNIDCYNTDFCVKVRHGMRYWNMTVQWWLHHYIYPNAPFKAYTLRYVSVYSIIRDRCVYGTCAMSYNIRECVCEVTASISSFCRLGCSTTRM